MRVGKECFTARLNNSWYIFCLFLDQTEVLNSFFMPFIFPGAIRLIGLAETNGTNVEIIENNKNFVTLQKC